MCAGDALGSFESADDELVGFLAGRVAEGREPVIVLVRAGEVRLGGIRVG